MASRSLSTAATKCQPNIRRSSFPRFTKYGRRPTGVLSGDNRRSEPSMSAIAIFRELRHSASTAMAVTAHQSGLECGSAVQRCKYGDWQLDLGSRQLSYRNLTPPGVFGDAGHQTVLL